MFEMSIIILAIIIGLTISIAIRKNHKMSYKPAEHQFIKDAARLDKDLREFDQSNRIQET